MIEGRSDTDRFSSTLHALSLVGVEQAVQAEMLRALAAILYIGEVGGSGVCWRWPPATQPRSP
jgi:myosin heavy subunit